MTIILFILILSVLVLVHEFGHFIAAKRNGIRVEEFGLGLPPKILAKKVGETTYSLNLLPFGGFVKLTGEDEADGPQVSGIGAVQGVSYDAKSFSVKKPWQRLSVLIAGVFMNALLAIFLYYSFFFINSFRTFQIPLFFDYKFKFGEIVNELNTVVVGTQKGLGAYNAGVEPGVAILEVDGVPVKNIQEVKAQLAGKPDQEVTLKLIDYRNQASPKTSLVKTKTSPDSGGNPILGVYLGKSVSIAYGKPVEKIFAGFLHSYNMIGYTISAFSHLIGISVETRDITPVSENVAGPWKIYEILSAILKFGGSGLAIMDFMALMSISLAVINVLPLPALDGGRLAFIVIEWVTGKRVNPVWEANIHKIGMFFLLCLIVLITIKDIAL